MNKLYIYVFVFVVAIGFIKWGHAQVYEQGYNAHKAEIKDSQDKAIKDSKAKAKKILELKKKLSEAKGKKIYVIKKIKDKTGCLDTDLSTLQLDGLL